MIETCSTPSEKLSSDGTKVHIWDLIVQAPSDNEPPDNGGMFAMFILVAFIAALVMLYI